ncbi:C2 domain-containing protein [Lactarius hengduanensis]|nr:C2 domain-containing protein [Lactarius pseudohatsudake]KAH9037351.1 C2 domain-containing protein [Lactarius hengduanensis]
MTPSNTAPEHNRITQLWTREGSRLGDSSSGETPVVILRVQVLSCHDLKAKDRNGYSDPFVIVSILEKQSSTPVCKRSLNPVYKQKDATFDFPIHISESLLNTLGTLDFAVWDHDTIRNDFLGKCSLPVHQWIRGTAFAFNDRNNQPLSVDLASSHSATPVCGTIRIKVGFVHPHDSTSVPDFGKTYNTLISHGGIVLLEICSAKNLPKQANLTHTGWDMDPFVEVSIGEEVKRTKVIRHSLDPVWDEQLLLHVRGADLSHSSASIQLTVIDWNKLTFNDRVGQVEINIAAIIEGAKKNKEPNTGPYSVDFPTMVRFDCFLTKNSTTGYTYPTLTFRASYQSYVNLRNQVE